MRLILASGSPRRRELLEAAGFVFDVDPVHVDETHRAEELPEAYVERLAREKALAGARRHPGAIVIGADTTVVLDGEVLGKPGDAEDAARMLRRLSGRTHEVVTGLAVARDAHVNSMVERTTVWMTAWPDEAIASAVASSEPFDKAGAYAIQGYASRFVPRVDGSYSNVVGLPVEALVRILRELPQR
jgi:septum formation protein